jgi:hypothetical protein
MNSHLLRARIGFAMVAALWAAIVLSCAGKHQETRPPAWTLNPPRQCVTGFSGPTVRPGDQIRYAQMNARINFAKLNKGMTIQDIFYDDGVLPSYLTDQTVESLVEGAHIVAMWTSEGPSSERTMHALACPVGMHPPGIGLSKEVPDWIYTIPTPGGELCALGVSGPTVRSHEQKSYALNNGAQALGAARATRVAEKVQDNGSLVYTMYRRETLADEEVAYCRANSRESESWLDETGLGPVRHAKVMYVLVCMPR